MLDTTLTTEFAPGTNLKGGVAGANWSFLLPSLDLEQIVCFGAPSAATLATLARLGGAVTVVCANTRQLTQVRELSRRSGLDNIELVAIDGAAALPAPDSSVDLALVLGRDGARRLAHDGALLAELRRLLKPEGLIYCESDSPIELLPGRDEEFGAQMFLLMPRGGEMHAAIPLGDRETIGYFLRNALYSSSSQLRVLKRAERFIARHRLLGRLTRRYAALLRSSAAADDGPPRYLRAIAQDAGISIDRHRWGLSARGQFSSRKVLFFLFNRASTAPEYIVKITRDAALNRRLENERRALALLWERGIGDAETLPRVAFAGRHGGLAIVAETAIAGAPFRTRTTATADCPYARAAIDWLIELGAATADRIAATPAQVAQGLEALLDQFAAIYTLAPAQRAFLEEQIALIGRSRAAFPLVFQHGDPGTWNILVTESERVAFLDWEAAEPQGMPLWDLLYFIRAHAVWSGRLGGARDSLKSFVQLLMADSAYSRLLVEATDRYCERSGLAKELVEPLFYTCWMHRALKEATRLAADQLEQGHYVSLLRLCMSQREAPTFRRLFALSNQNKEPGALWANRE